MIDFSFSMLDLEYFLLILVRVSCFVFVAPFYGMTNTPGRVKIGLSFFLAVLLYQVLTPAPAVEYNTVLGYSVIVLKEAVTGLLIGFVVNICNSIIHFAGSVIDMEIGFSMVTLMDPATRENTSVSGIFYQYLVMLLLVVTGMYQYILKAFVESFTLIPINGAVFRTEALIQTLIRFMGDSIILGFRICLPVFAVMLMLNAVLGILAKVSPQLNMFAVGLQLKVLVGLSVLFFTISMLPGAADFIFTEMKKMMVSVVEGMM